MNRNRKEIFEKGADINELKGKCIENGRQKAEVMVAKTTLASIESSNDSAKIFSNVGPGSLVVTNKGTYYVAISIGRLNLAGY